MRVRSERAKRVKRRARTAAGKGEREMSRDGTRASERRWRKRDRMRKSEKRGKRPGEVFDPL